MYIKELEPDQIRNACCRVTWRERKSKLFETETPDIRSKDIGFVSVTTVFQPSFCSSSLQCVAISPFKTWNEYFFVITC